MIDGANGILTGFGREPYDAKTGGVDFFGELIDGDVGRRDDEDLAHVGLLGEMIHERGGGDGLARPRRALDERQGSLDDGCDGFHLTLVERGQARHGEFFVVGGDLGGGNALLFDGVAEEAVVDVPGDGGVVDGEGLERILHAVEGGGFPNVLDDVVVRDLVGEDVRAPASTAAATALHLDLDLPVEDGLDVPRALPLLAVVELGPLAELEAQLVPDHDLALVGREATAKGEGGDVLAREALLPAHGNAAGAEGLLHLPIVVGLHLDQRRQDVLVVIPVLVPQQGRGEVGVVDDVGPVEVGEAGVGLGLPQLLELVDLRLGEVPREEQLLLGRHLDEPREELAVLHEGVPLAELPVHVLQLRHRLHAHAAQQHHHRRAARRDEPQHERVLAAAVVALEDRVAQGGFGVELDLVRSRPHQVVHEVRPAPAGAGGVAQPLLRLDALGHAGGVVDAAVPAGVVGEELLQVRVDEGVGVAVVVGELGRGRGVGEVRCGLERCAGRQGCGVGVGVVVVGIGISVVIVGLGFDFVVFFVVYELRIERHDG